MHSKSERYRIILSRIAAAAVLFFIFTTKSVWETKNETITFFLFLMGMILVGIASLGRMWCSLYIAGYKDDKLVTDGPYSICRNPLYFFSMIGVIGIGCATETFTFPIVFIFLFALYYPFVIKSEERRLQQLFGSVFERYSKKVSTFFPRLSTFSEPEEYVVKPAVYRNHIFSALWFVWIVGVLEVIEGLREIGVLSSLWTLY
ncbi:methyltransferase family protein [Desulfosarcina widdelii]|uniref:methyltransferase family protein n=1 Tax=Desulfosarcina widdelii TaxID=947919 RepID=UPI0012D311E3|nr:isoprenylcysteine carboxylmethyltransferase family protein [Desulfosarcina widdelii]